MGIQTDLLTKNKQSYEKEFIDFSFNEKYISEFGLVAVFDGDRLSLRGSADFENETTEIKAVPGQYFWGTNFKSKKRTFELATDGMTEKQFNAFKMHFRPGYYGKFIEDSEASRYSYCRVSEVTEFSFVPFRKEISLSFTREDGSITTHYTHINEYKGSVKITFEWDYPFTFSRKKYVEDSELNPSEFETIFKAIYNNNIAFSTSWVSKFIKNDNAILGLARLNFLRLGYRESYVNICHLGTDKCLERTNNNGSRLIEDLGHTGKNVMVYYNPSTADSQSKISLKYTPAFTEVEYSYTSGDAAPAWKTIYFSNINDKYNCGPQLPYNTIEASTILELLGYSEPYMYSPTETDFIYKFHYSTPSVINSIHQVISIAEKMYNDAGGAAGGQVYALSLEEKLRENITNDKVLKWAISCLAFIRTHKDGLCNKELALLNTKVTASDLSVDWLGSDITKIKANWFIYFNLLMLCFFMENTNKSSLSLAAGSDFCWDTNIKPIWVTFDGIEAKTTIKYNYSYVDAGSSVQFFIDQEETCGDMILSPYLKLGGGNTISEDGIIESCYCLRFKRGGEEHDVELATLEYDYVYI